MLSINAKTRGNDRADKVRAEGFIPAVVYGPKKETISISVPKQEFIKAFKEAGESTTVTLMVDGAKHDVLIHEVEYNPVAHTPMHVDFYAVDMNKPIEVSVPLEFDGVAPAVKGNIGTLVKVMHELQIVALPKDLPHSVMVDMSGLVDLDSQIAAGDIALPKGVTLVTPVDEVVAAIAALAADEPTDAPVMDLSAIEVEKKGKKEEEPEAE
jgi:large subunit ribosomal protein L25